MKIADIINKYYDKLYKYCVVDNRVISQSRTPEDILQDVCFTALRKFKDDDIDEELGLGYLKKNIFTEHKFKYSRKKNELVIFTDEIPDKGYNDNFDN